MATPPQPSAKPALRPDAPPTPRTLRARLLGPVHLAVGERPLPVEMWPRRTARSLLLLLLATPGHRLPRERAVDLLWQELPPQRVRDTWYQALSTLRRVLEPGLPARQPSAFLTVDAATVALSDRLTVWTDIGAFEEELRRADDAAPDAQRTLLRAALAIYRGDLLAEEPAVEWALGRREELRLAWQGAVLRLAELDLNAGEPLASLAALRALLAADRTAEEVHRALIRAFLATGDREQALRQYERCRHVLRENLGIEPNQLTHELLLAGDAGAPRQRAPHPAVEAAPRRDPPVPVTPLVGRGREIDVVEDLLWRADVRLVTLTGPGGVGKTRLAIEVARRFVAEEANVVFVPLATIRAPDLVPFAVGQALGVRNDEMGSSLEAVRRRIGEHEVLLVLDNVEHLAVAVAALVADLLAGCRGLTVLTTSRIALRLGGEHVVAVPPLALPAGRQPSFAALARAEAVALFAQRARAAKADFALTAANAPVVAELCARLDGLPLAIELAAARVGLLSPRAMLARLDHRLDLLSEGPRDAPERLRTMREAIGWSHDLLDDAERAIFRRLAVFAGGASLAAARWVTIDHIEEGMAMPDAPVIGDTPFPVPAALAGLVDHSLLRQDEQADGEPRFTMLETIRAFAMERLQASGEAAAIQRRHASWLIAFAEATVPCLGRTVQAAELERLAAEIDNVRAALSWALAHGEPALALRLATATFQLWFARATPSEGQRWLEDSLAAAPDAPGTLRADALLCASMLAFIQGKLPHQVKLADEALAIAQAGGYRFGAAVALYLHGVAAERRYDLEEAAARYDEVLAVMREIGDQYWTTLLLTDLARVGSFQGRFSEAAPLADEALVRWRDMGNDWGIAQGLSTVAAIAHQRGDLRRAALLYQESLAPWLALDDRQGIAGALVGLAGTVGSVGLSRRAARLLGAANALGAGAGVRILAHHAEYERVVSATREQLEERAFAAEWAAGRALSIAQAMAEAEEASAAIAATGNAEASPGLAPSPVVPLRRRA